MLSSLHYYEPNNLKQAWLHPTPCNKCIILTRPDSNATSGGIGPIPHQCLISSIASFAELRTRTTQQAVTRGYSSLTRLDGSTGANLFDYQFPTSIAPVHWLHRGSTSTPPRAVSHICQARVKTCTSLARPVRRVGRHNTG